MAKDAAAKRPHHLGKIIFVVVFTSIAAGTLFIVHGQVLNTLSPSPGIVGPQFWDLTNNAGQTATVLINPFTKVAHLAKLPTAPDGGLTFRELIRFACMSEET